MDPPSNGLVRDDNLVRITLIRRLFSELIFVILTAQGKLRKFNSNGVRTVWR